MGGYTISAHSAALVRTPDYPNFPSRLEVQASLSVSHWQLWLDNLELYEVPYTWIDSTGATGEAYCFTLSTSPLAASGYLAIADPTPGAQWFTVTLGKPGDQIILRIELEEEVPFS